MGQIKNVEIVGDAKDTSPTFDDLADGECFWHGGELYMKDDEGEAICLRDGIRTDNFDGDDYVSPQKVRIECVG